MPQRTDPISRSLRALYEDVRVAYLSARERPKDYRDKWIDVVDKLKLKWDSPQDIGDLLREKIDESLLFDENAKDPTGAKAKRIYESMKQLTQDADLSKDPFRKKFGEELPKVLVKDKTILAMFLHWAYRLGRGALDNWKTHTKIHDNFTEGYVGLDLTDEEIFDWMEDNYGEELDLKRVKSKLDGARQLLYEVFTEDHTPKEWNQLVDSKRVLKAGRGAARKELRQYTREAIDKYVQKNEEFTVADIVRDLQSQFNKSYKGLEIAHVTIGQWVGAYIKFKVPNYTSTQRSSKQNLYEPIEKSLVIKEEEEEEEEEGTKNNFILPNKPMYRIFEIDDMKELKGFTGEWVVQEKYDGLRIQIHKTDSVKVYSYNNREITGKFDKQINILTNEKFPKCILDAEAVLYDGDDPLHRADTLAYVNSKKQSKDYKLKVHVFDIMRHEEEDIGPKKLEERLQTLMQNYSPNSHEFLQFPNKRDTRFADSLEEIEEYAKTIMKNPTSEGVMIKDAKSSYIIGKKKNPKWIKWKKFVDLDLLVLDVRKNKNGTYSYTLGASANDTEYKPLVEIDGEKYLSVGKALNTKIKSEKGKIVRVKVDEVKKTTNGFSIYSAKVIEIPEVSEAEKVITLEFLSKDNKKSASDYNIEALKKSYEITDNIHGTATLNTTLDTDGFVLTGFFQDNLMAKNAIIDIDIWKEKLKEAHIKDNGNFLTKVQQLVMERPLTAEELDKKLKESNPDLYERVFSESKNIEKSLSKYLEEKGDAYGIKYNKETDRFSYDGKSLNKSIIKMDNNKYEIWKREDGDLNFIYKTKDREFAWRIEQDDSNDIYELFGKAAKYLAQVDKKANKSELLDKGEMKLGSQRDGYHEYLLKGEMYEGKFHLRVVPIKKEKKWVAWTGYETKPTDASSDDDKWNIEADKYRNIRYSE